MKLLGVHDILGYSCYFDVLFYTYFLESHMIFVSTVCTLKMDCSAMNQNHL